MSVESWWMKMKIINVGSRVMNTWLYAVSDGWVMVDTGYPESMARVIHRMKRAGILPEEVKVIFLTHAHDDHAGFLNAWLARYPQVKVVASEKSLAVLLRGQNPFDGGCSSILAWVFCQVMKLAGKGAHRFPTLEWQFLERFVLAEKQHMSEAEALVSGRILATPGHTADSLSLMVDDLVFCGDAAMNGLPSLRRVTIWIENMEDFAHSWETLITSGAAVLYPGHGRPFKMADLVRFQSALRKIRLYCL